MRKKPDPEREEGISVLAVLAAAAREAEELLNSEDIEYEPEAAEEANRRLQLFMRTARQLAR